MNIHFACTMCGGCCSFAPSMNIYDMIELSDQFIFQVAHKTKLSNVKTPLEKNLLEHYQHLGHTLVLPELDSTLFYWVELAPIIPPSYTTCPKLVDKKCSIYDKRPMTCKLQPLDHKYPESEQSKVIQFYKDKTEKKEWNCDFSEKAPLLITGEDISSIHLNSMYYNQLQQIRDFTDKYLDFMNLYQGRQETHLKTVVKAYISKSSLVSDIIQPLFVLIYNNIIEKELAYKIVENQINLINMDIKRAVDFKIKKDIKYSRLYKKILDAYNKALKNKIFESIEVNE